MNRPARMILLLLTAVFALASFQTANGFFGDRRMARKILRDTVDALRLRLPAPNDPDLAPAMPRGLTGLRDGFLYYPDRNAYKYTFTDNAPQHLERRSIWLAPRNGRWLCWAGVKDSVAAADCGDREIVKGLKEEEHFQAQTRAHLYSDWCNRALPPPDWENAPVYVVYSPQQSVWENSKPKWPQARVRAEHFADAHLVLFAADKQTDWLLDLPERPKSLTLIGAAEDSQLTVNPAPADGQSAYLFSYEASKKACEKLAVGRYDTLAEYYENETWQEQAVARLFRNPTVRPLITVLDEAHPEAVLDAAAHKGRLKNNGDSAAADGQTGGQ